MKKPHTESSDDTFDNHYREMGRYNQSRYVQKFFFRKYQGGCGDNSGEKNSKKPTAKSGDKDPLGIFSNNESEPIIYDYGWGRHNHGIDTQGGDTPELEQHGLQEKGCSNSGESPPQPSNSPTTPFRIKWALDGPMGTCTKEATKNEAANMPTWAIFS